MRAWCARGRAAGVLVASAFSGRDARREEASRVTGDFAIKTLLNTKQKLLSIVSGGWRWSRQLLPIMNCANTSNCLNSIKSAVGLVSLPPFNSQDEQCCNAQRFIQKRQA
jgi:hypothetical protein